MSIKNFSTKVSVEKTVMNIQKILAENGARQILLDFGDKGEVIALSFRIEVGSHGLIPFRLPARIDRTHAVLARSREIPSRYKNRDQACKVAWRIIKHWLDNQLAMIKIENVDFVEVFLPFAQSETGETLYERFKKSPQLLLNSKN